MKLENQVCSLELAKKLKELGVKQESLFYWMVNHQVSKDDIAYGSYDDWYLEYIDEVPSSILSGENKERQNETYCAFTVAELGEMLPNYISRYPDGFYYWQFKANEENDCEGKWQCYYKPAYGNLKQQIESLCETYSNTEANARAKCLIYLIEQGIIKL